MQSCAATYDFARLCTRQTKGARGRAPFVFPRREARAYFDAAARRRISDAIVFARAESLAPFASASTWRASLFREAARAAPLCFSAASSDLAIAEVLSLARPSLRTSWSRYERTTGNAAGQTSFGWLCGLYSFSVTSFAAAISFAESCGLGVSS